MARTTEEVMVTLQDLGCREITESQANVANDNLLGEERILAAFSGIEPRGDSVKIKIPFIATQYRILILASEIEEG